MEIAALGVFEYNLRISPYQWEQFLERTRAYNQHVVQKEAAVLPLPAPFVVGRVLNDLLASSRIAKASDAPEFLGRKPGAHFVSTTADLKRKRDLIIEVDEEPEAPKGTWQPLVPRNGPTMLARKKTPAFLEWETESDPVVCKARRIVGTAIGAERASALRRGDTGVGRGYQSQAFTPSNGGNLRLDLRAVFDPYVKEPFSRLTPAPGTRAIHA